MHLKRVEVVSNLTAVSNNVSLFGINHTTVIYHDINR